VLRGRVITPGDPLWTQTDTDLAIALVEVEHQQHDCGHPRSETMDPDNEFAYEATPVRCHACAAIDRAAKTTDIDAAGLRWIVTQKEAT